MKVLLMTLGAGVRKPARAGDVPRACSSRKPSLLVGWGGGLLLGSGRGGAGWQEAGPWEVRALGRAPGSSEGLPLAEPKQRPEGPGARPRG